MSRFLPYLIWNEFQLGNIEAPCVNEQNDKKEDVILFEVSFKDDYSHQNFKKIKSVKIRT